MICCVKYIVFCLLVLLMIVEWIFQHVQTEIKNKNKETKQNKTKKKKEKKKTDWPKILKYVIPSLCHRPRNCNLSNLCGRCKSLAPEIVSWFLGLCYSRKDFCRAPIDLHS